MWNNDALMRSLRLKAVDLTPASTVCATSDSIRESIAGSANTG